MQLRKSIKPCPGWTGEKSLATLVVAVLLVAPFGCDSIVGFAPDAEGQPPDKSAATSLVPSADGCVTGAQPGGALYEICVPEGGGESGTLILYAHGFVFPQAPLTLPSREAGVDVSEFVTRQGFAYAATSYGKNGLVDAKHAIRDLRNLIVQYTQLHGTPERVLLFGVSNGALVATLALEQNPGLFDGAFAACAPVGDYFRQVNYLADIFVLFQHYFPGVIEGGPEGFAPEYIQSLTVAAAGAGISLEDYLTNVVIGAMAQDQASAGALLSVLKMTPEIAAGFDPMNISEGFGTIVRAVIYNIVATNDAREVLGGSFYGNTHRQYVGAGDNVALNQEIARYSADLNAVRQIQTQYETTGRIDVPVVTLHTLRDPTVPFWHTDLYADKLGANGSLRTIMQVDAFGHCTFTESQVQTAFDALLTAL